MDTNGNSKELLIKDLCSRLPYGVKIMFSHNGFRWDWEQTLDEIRLCDDGEYAVNGWGIHVIKPYLRPMCSMTDEERLYFYRNSARVPILVDEKKIITKPFYGYTNHLLDYLNAHHLDYRNLIPLGLALEAPKDMYKTE